MEPTKGPVKYKMEEIIHNLRVALYCRVSTDEQREGQTIESQIRELERFAKEKGWITVDVYKDEGWSGSLLARPELDRLRDDASRGLFDAVLINDVDRIARDVTHLGVIKRDLERRSVRVIFRKIPGEQSPTYNLLVNVLGSFAEFEREMIADRTRRGRRYKVEVRQQFLGSIAPYGFKYIPKNTPGPETGILELLPDEAATVRQIYRWVDEEGISIRGVVVKLNESGVVPRKGGRRWQKSSVRRILRSEVYAGIWHYNKHQLCEPRRRAQDRRYHKSTRSSLRLRPKADWLPVVLPEQLRIISRSQWRSVQEQIARNTSFSPRNAKHVYLLRGLLRCGGCHSAYVGEPCHGRFAYRCSKRCKAYGSISESSLNTTVWNAVSEAFKNPEVIVEAIAAANESSKTRIEGEEKEIERGLVQIDAEELRVFEAYRLEILSPEQLARELEMIRARRAMLQSRKSTRDWTKQLNGTPIQKTLEDYCQAIADGLNALDLEKRQRLLRLLVGSIVFENDLVRIRCIIPCPDGNSSDLGTIPPEDGPLVDVRRIESTMSYLGARNTTYPYKDAKRWSHDSSDTITFELLRQIEKDTTIARAASSANLMKANEALKKKREAKRA